MSALTPTSRPTPAAPPTRPGPAARLLTHLRDPMQRSAYALMLGNVANSGFGFLFWVVAARYFTADVVGTATSMIAAMGFLANVATLGLRGGLIRFLPVAGTGVVRLAWRSYAVCGLAAATAASVFVLGQGLWADDLGLLRDNPLAAVAFAGATVVWVGTILQEYVLIGLRRATWVPAAGVSYSLLKIVFLVAVPVASAWTVFAAYTLPALVVLVLVNAVVLRLVVAQATTPVATAAGSPSVKGLVRFATGDHAAAMLWLATTELLPLVVLAEAGASASAYYYLAFTVGYSLYLVTSSIGNALVAEGARTPDRLRELARQAVRNGLLLVVPAAAIGIVAAPFVLGLLGTEYRDQATGLLQLLVLSAIPQVLVGVAISVAKVRRQISRLVAIYAAMGVLVYGGSIVALRTVGLTGVGAAWLIAQIVVASVLSCTYLSFLWRRQVSDVLVRSASSVRRDLLKAVRRREVRQLAGRVAEACGVTLTQASLLTSNNDTLVFAAVLGGRDVVVKLARSAESSVAVSRHARSARAAAQAVDPRSRELVAAVLHHGELDGRAYVVEEWLPGDPLQGDGLPTRPVPAEAAVAARRFDEIHRATARTLKATDATLDQLVHEPLRALAGVPGGTRTVAELAGLRDVLVLALSRRPLTVSWTHGDCWLGNVLGVAHGADTVVTGLVDWEDARPAGLPDLDLAHLWLTSQGGEIGERLVAALADGGGGFVAWLAENGIIRPNRHLDTRLVLILAWLAHVHTGIRRNPPDGPGRVWRSRNVDVVARRLGQVYGASRTPGVHASATEPVWLAALRSVDPVHVSTVVALTAVLQFWLIGLWRVDPRAMTDLGLTSLLGWPTIASLLVLLASFLFVLARGGRDLLLGAHLVTLIVLVHGTPAVLFGTLRYAWAWKHLGIVDYILRHGRVDTSLENLGIYHNWPGFFGGSAFLADLAGPEHLFAISIWAPVVFNIANLLALRFLFRSFGADRISVWLALVLFFISTWVGQDYFSPQAFAFVLYLLVVGIVLRHFRRRPLDDETGPWRTPVLPLFLVTLLLAAVAMSHQITPMAIFLALAVLFLGRQTRGWYLPVLAVVAAAGWAFTGARQYTLMNIADLLAEVNNPVSNAEDTFDKSATITGGQHLVSWAGRGVIVLIGLVAVIGIVRLLRRRQLDRALLLLAGAPGLMLFMTAFGGELLFRIFLFSSPFLAYFSAMAVLPDPATDRRRTWRAMIPALALSALIIPGFLLAYYGKDQQNYFTPGEVAASQWVADNSVPGTMVIRGNTNYPRDFSRYELARNLDISAENGPDRERILADPVGTFTRWMSDERNARAFLILTRSQKIANDSLGPMEPGALQKLDDTLAASPDFRQAFRNEDAVVYVLADIR